MNSVLPFFYNNRVVVVHMAAKLLYIFQLPLQLDIAMWNVRSGVCHLQLWDFRHPDIHVLAFFFLPTGWNPSTQPLHADERNILGL